MTTQVIFKIDKKLKDQAMKKAQGEGIAFASVLKLATQAYIKGRLDVQLVAQPQLNSRTRKMLSHELREVKAGKNVSPRFNNAKDAINFLKNLK
jgi:antitoxin component of RelBE/YafQ-DinJ toxin-antitoxin module